MPCAGMYRSFDLPGLYVISIQGHLTSEASRFLNDLSVTSRETEGNVEVTILSGELQDQAALIGVLNTLYERGFVVLTVNRILPA